MKKALCLLLVLCTVVTCAVGCESQEDYETHVIKAVENKVNGLMIESEEFSQITNKEWSYSRSEDGQEVVTMTGTITYIISATVVFRFYVDTDEGYITKMSYTVGDYSETSDLPRNEHTKLNL